MPRKTKPKRAAESGITGLWFKCANGHLVEEPIYLADRVYCPDRECPLITEVVHSTQDDKGKTTPNEWNKTFVPIGD